MAVCSGLFPFGSFSSIALHFSYVLYSDSFFVIVIIVVVIFIVVVVVVVERSLSCHISLGGPLQTVARG